jgi:ribosome modulation factor
MQITTKEYIQGRDAFNAGYSIHYNPFLDTGSVNQFADWICGWRDAKLDASWIQMKKRQEAQQ